MAFTLLAAACAPAAAPRPTAPPPKPTEATKAVPAKPAPAATPAEAKPVPTSAPAAKPAEAKPAASPAAKPASNVAPPADWRVQWEQTLAAAKREGALVVVGPTGPLQRQAVAHFEQAHPEIKLEYSSMSIRDFGPKILAERQAGQYLWDVEIGGATGPNVQLKPRGVFDPVKSALILPEILDDARWLGGFDAGYYDKEKTYAYKFQATLSFSGWVNRDIVPEPALNRIEDVVDSKWADKIVWQDPRTPGGGGAAAYLLQALGPEFLRKLYGNQIVLSRDQRQQVEWLVRGQYPIAFAVQTATLRDFQDKGAGANVKPLGPESVGGVRLTTGNGALMMLNRPPHPNAAKVFANWLLSREGMSIWAKEVRECSRRLDVSECPPENRPQPGKQYGTTDAEEYEHLEAQAMQIANQVLK